MEMKMHIVSEFDWQLVGSGCLGFVWGTARRSYWGLANNITLFHMAIP